jgi:hypothetical protein
MNVLDYSLSFEFITSMSMRCHSQRLQSCLIRCDSVYILCAGDWVLMLLSLIINN